MLAPRTVSIKAPFDVLIARAEAAADGGGGDRNHAPSGIRSAPEDAARPSQLNFLAARRVGAAGSSRAREARLYLFLRAASPRPDERGLVVVVAQEFELE